MKTLIRNGILITPRERIEDGWLLIQDDRILGIGRDEEPLADRTIDAAGRYVAPGFIDLHVQGFRGYNLCDESDDDFLNATRRMAQAGTTACQASLDPDPPDPAGAAPWSFADAAARLCKRMAPRIGRSDGGARVLGLYFEMPFISPGKLGAIPAQLADAPSVELAQRVIEMAAGKLSMITIAPELPGALDLVRLFARTEGPHGAVVVALGHTGATYEEAVAGIDAGIRHVTHVYNAMTGLHHRQPGALGAALTDPRVSVGLITDGIHVHPAAVRLAIAARGIEKTCIITDAVSARDGHIVDGAPRLPDGTLNGSILSMDRAVANVLDYTGLSVAQAVEMATLSPARAIHWHDRKGSLVPGKDADVVLFDEGVNIAMTMIGGEVVWEAPGD